MRPVTMLLPTVFIAACGHTYVRALSPARFPAIPADSVQVFMTSAPERYTELALLDITRGDNIVAAVRREAGKLGANGVLYVERHGHTAPPTSDLVSIATYDPGGFYWIAIRYDASTPVRHVQAESSARPD